MHALFSPRARLRGLLAVALLSLGVARAEVGPDAARQLVRDSGTAAQLAQLPDAVFNAAAETAQALNLPPALRPALERAARQAFQPQRLLATTEAAVARDLDATAAAAALSWWRSADGQRIRQLEDACSARQARDLSGWMAHANAAHAAAGAPRRLRLDGIERAVQGAELMADLQIQAVGALLDGLAGAAPPQAAREMQGARQQMQRQRPQMVAAGRGMLQSMLAGCYLQASDAELDRYLAFLRSPEGRRATQALLRGVGLALSDGAQAFGRSLPGVIAAAPR